MAVRCHPINGPPLHHAGRQEQLAPAPKMLQTTKRSDFRRPAKEVQTLTHRERRRISKPNRCMQKRQHTLDYVKGSENYRRVEDARQRGGHDIPLTPDLYDRSMSKRAWEKAVRAWRSQLEQFSHDGHFDSARGQPSKLISWTLRASLSTKVRGRIVCTRVWFDCFS